MEAIVKARGCTALQRLLDERAMTQQELSLRSGVSRETICRLANGSNRCERVTVLLALAWALDVDPYALRALYDGPLPYGPRVRVETLPIGAKAVGA